MNTRIRRIVLPSIVGILMFASFIAGNVTGYLAHPVLAAERPAQFEVFWEAWDLVMEHFVDRNQIDPVAMTYGAIEGMLSTLGDEGHTVFFSPEMADLQREDMSGSFEGIGAYIGQEEGVIRIVAPIDGSPAENAGILAGDVILAVDGTPIEGMSQHEVILLIRGPANTEVVLTVRHADSDESTDIAIVRRRIELKSVNWSMIPGSKVAYLQITQFAINTGAELETALQEVMATRIDGEGVESIVLDLRNNPGGYLMEAVRVGGQFLPEGSTILLETDAEENLTNYQSRGNGYGREIPLVVLINEGTASAGEIIAGAIQAHGRGTLIGETTFGTGTVLQPFELSDGSVLRLGVRNWLTPDGNLVKGEGIAPDLEVAMPIETPLIDTNTLMEISAEDLATTDDQQFLKALEQLGISMPTLLKQSLRDGPQPLR